MSAEPAPKFEPKVVELYQTNARQADDLLIEQLGRFDSVIIIGYTKDGNVLETLSNGMVNTDLLFLARAGYRKIEVECGID